MYMVIRLLKSVKYRKALLDSEIAHIIQEKAEKTAERYPIEMEAIGCDNDHIHLLCGAHPKNCTRQNCSDIQKHNSPRNISTQAN